MASSLQIVDPDNEATVLYDFHDPTGANSALYGAVWTKLITDVNFGTPSLAHDAAVGPTDPRSVAFARLARRTVSFRHVVLGANYDALQTAVGYLGRYIADGACLRWVPDGSTQ